METQGQTLAAHPAPLGEQGNEAVSTAAQFAPPASGGAQALALMAGQSAPSTAATAHPELGQQGVPGPAGTPGILPMVATHGDAPGAKSMLLPPNLVDATQGVAVPIVAPLGPSKVAQAAAEVTTSMPAHAPASLAQTTVQPPVAMPDAAQALMPPQFGEPPAPNTTPPLAAPHACQVAHDGGRTSEGVIAPTPHTMFFNSQPLAAVPAQQQSPATLAPVGAVAAAPPNLTQQSLQAAPPGTPDQMHQQSQASLAPGASTAAQPAALGPTSHIAPTVAATMPSHNSAAALALEGKTAETPVAAEVPGQGSAQSGQDQVFFAALQTIAQKGMAGGAQEALLILDSVLKMRSGSGSAALGSAAVAPAGNEAAAAPNAVAPATPVPPPAPPPDEPGLPPPPGAVVADDAGQLARKTWANSVTHPKEWISFKRFSEKNSELCSTVCQAFASAAQDDHQI